MGTLVDSGLGWYLDEDYLITLGSQTLGTVDSGGVIASPPCLPEANPDDSSTWGAAIPLYSWPGNTGYWYNAASTNKVLFYARSGYYGSFYISDAPFRRISYWNTPSQYPETNGSVQVQESGYTNLHCISDSYSTQLPPVSGSPYVKRTVSSYQEALADAASYFSGGGQISTITKVQGGAGAFAFVSYPKDAGTVYVGVGISSIPNPNSAATVAVDGINGSYDTFNREYINFTMYYTPELSGTLTNNVPVVSISDELDTSSPLYAVRLFLAVANAAQIHAGPAPQGEDPYAPGGTSGPGGGIDTDFDITGDTILDSSLPTFSFANSGFARIYNPNLSQLQSLANYLWTDSTFLQTVVNHAKQLLEDPIESIITLNRLPISVPNGTAEVVKVLYIPTNTSMPPVTNQFVDVDCGTLQIKHEYDSALDYNPYTDISLVLPFIGVVQLDPDEVMDKTLSLTYRVDVVSGMCVAKVAVDGCVLYQYSGNCAISMPFNSADFSNYISAMVTAAKSIAGVAAAGAAGAVAAAAEGTDAVKSAVVRAMEGETSMPQLPSSNNLFKETFGKGSIGEGTLKAAKKGVANTVSAVVSSKRTIEHAGHFSGNSGFLGVRRPYAIIKRPRMCNPEEYGRFNGRPCMMYLYLGRLSGYTEVQEIHLTGILATNEELVEIENLLKSGVIL